MQNPERRLWVKEEDTAGLPESIKAAAREAAREALEEEGRRMMQTCIFSQCLRPPTCHS